MLTFVFTWTTFWVTIILIVVAMAVVLGACAYQILLERKVAAWAQDRFGPNRVGPWGLLQPIADGLKFLFKEEVIPNHVDKLFYLLAPAIALMTALMAFAVVPFGQTTPHPLLRDYRAAMAEYKQAKNDDDRNDALAKADTARPIWPETRQEEAEVLAADRAYAEAKGVQPFEERLKEYNDSLQFVIAPHVDIGVVWVFAIGSLAVYAIVLGGWSSNNKYSFLGSLRSSAQLISYEIPMGLSVLGVLLITGSLNLERIIAYQIDHGWNVIYQPLAALLFIVSIFAECNRLPFDLPEAEQELVGGYHTEYSAMKFACFFLAEYTHMITTSFLAMILFFGGWHFPWIATPEWTGAGAMVVKVLVFAVKVFLFIVFFMLVRWTLPRFRFDQLMSLAWKGMMPLALVNLVLVLCIRQYQPLGVYSHWLMLPLSLLVLVVVVLINLRMPGPPPRNLAYVRGIGRNPPAPAAGTQTR